MRLVEGIEIRPATEADVETLFALIVELASYEKLRDQVVGDPEALRRTLFEQRAAEALLIEDAGSGEAIGHAIFYLTFSSFECRPGIWLEDVYVKSERRGGGIGRAVMEHLAALALDRGYTRFEWCSLDWNPALEFYDAIGAKRLEEWTMLRLERDGMERLAAGRQGSAAGPSQQ
jgi:GNAT superfamily N-acetyltransferase